MNSLGARETDSQSVGVLGAIEDFRTSYVVRYTPNGVARQPA